MYVLVHQRSSRPGPVTAALLVAVAFGGAVAHGESRKLTLDEAVSLATQHNSMVKMAKDKVKEMDARVHQACANYFPVLSNETTAVHMSERQHIDIPAGAFGDYPGTGPIPGTSASLVQGRSSLLLGTTSVTQPITQYFKIRAGVDVSRADAAGARADVKRAQTEVAYKVKEIYFGILATERRRDAVDLQIRAAEQRMSEIRNAVKTGVSLEVTAVEARVQIARAKHGRGQLEDAVIDMKLELADPCGLKLDGELELAQPVASDLDPSPSAAAASEDALAHNAEIEAAGHQA